MVERILNGFNKELKKRRKNMRRKSLKENKRQKKNLKKVRFLKQSIKLY
jgi:hypothetical protein